MALDLTKRYVIYDGISDKIMVYDFIGGFLYLSFPWNIYLGEL